MQSRLMFREVDFNMIKLEHTLLYQESACLSNGFYHRFVPFRGKAGL